MKKLFSKQKIKSFPKFILFLNAVIFSFNFGFYRLINSINIKEKLFKYSDQFIMKLNKKSFNLLSKYLIDKYNINPETTKNKFSKIKKEIRIKCIGLFDMERQIEWLKNKLDDEFIINIDENNPDYLLYNVFTKDDVDLNYKNSIKIAFYTENVMPDLNLVDYAIGHYHIIYLDRYFKYTTMYWSNYDSINQRRIELVKEPIRKKFCAGLISNCNAKFRLNFINRLNKYKKVDMGGKCLNNINEIISNKIEFLSHYKFSIAIENSDGDGYTSEKIIDSFLAGTIPIYYGDYLLDEYFNPKSYIFIKGEKDIEKKIEYIKKIDENDDLYKSIIKEKPIIDKINFFFYKNFINKIDKLEIKLFLKHIFEQDKNKAYRRDDNYYDVKGNYLFLSLNLKFILIIYFLYL